MSNLPITSTQTRYISIAIFGAMVILTGCMSYNVPNDVSLTSVQLTDWNSTEVPGPDSPVVVRGMVSDRMLSAAGYSIDGGKRPRKELLKVEFTSRYRLDEFVTRDGYNVGVYAVFCNDHSHGWPINYPTVYYKGQSIDKADLDRLATLFGDSSGKFRYYFYMNISQEKMEPAKPPFPGFDLRSKASDVCFDLRGGSNSGFGYRSNVATISKSDIELALQSSPAISPN
jgi:hypothetical protein